MRRACPQRQCDFLLRMSSNPATKMHLAMDKLTLAEPLVRGWDVIRQMDWLEEILRRPAPLGIHMIQIAPHLFEAPQEEEEIKYHRRSGVDGRSRSRSRCPEDVDLSAPALSGKALAPPGKLRRTFAHFRVVQLLQLPRFDQHAHQLDRTRSEPHTAHTLSTPFLIPSLTSRAARKLSSPATPSQAPSCELPLLRTSSGTGPPSSKLRRAHAPLSRAASF